MRTWNRATAHITRCPHGHLYDEANTYINRHGARECRTCKRGWRQGRRPRRVSV